MSGKKRTWPKRYAEYVEAGLAESDEEFAEAMKQSPRCIGGDAFRAWVDELYEKLMASHGAAEDISFRHVTEPLMPEAVIGVLAEELGVEVGEFSRRRRHSVLRAAAARYLMRYAGLTQRDVARRLKAGSGSAISKQLAAHDAALGEGTLAVTLARIERRLEAARSQRQAQSR